MKSPVTLQQIFSTFLAICFVIILPHTGLIPLPFGYVIPVFFFIWLYLKYHKENFRSIGFSFASFSRRSFITGTIAGILIFLFLVFVFFPLLALVVDLPEEKVDLYTQIRGNTGFYIFLVVMGWVVGGFYEEIVFHGFIFTYLEKLFPRKSSVIISFLLTNTLFALYHIQLGYEGVINALLAGSGYHALVLMHKRNLWYGIICHAVFDTIALTVLYFGGK